ncbi:MAG: DNA repair protein RecN [Bacteroidetes bacterium]|nr:MAG: DNA repair protein RecN [Bacteroidota bacterium]
MLKSLLIENYALIEKLDISFDDGLTIITGETGAGKSILLGALGLILGQRADIRALHNKNSKCIIEGVFQVRDLQMEHLFEENELDYDDITIFRREITPQGKSRAFINDTPVNLNILKLFAEQLIDIHSQHQSLMFANSAFRYNLTDAYAGILATVLKYRKEFTLWQQEKNTLNTLIEQERQVRAELDYFQFQFDELHKAALVPGESEEIERELQILNNAGEIKFNLEKADYLLQNSPENILSFLNELIGLFKPLERYDSAYADISVRLKSTEIELKDITSGLSGLKQDIADDPARAMQLQQRFDLLLQLMHKHNARTINELIQIKEDFQQKIEGIESLEMEIGKISNLCQQKETQLKKSAAEISALRAKAIPGLEKQINIILKELGMPNGRFMVKQTPHIQLHQHGLDELEFLFSANLGAAPQELSRVASGGELSRLMLAVKSVISLKNLLPTIIFDEIDTGVSGEIGFKMGNILSKIARNMQVISVTHLPQVAARGKKHFVVYKQIENQTTKTIVKEVDAKARVHEIAQMLGGENPGPAVLQAAEELFEKQNINKN